MSSIRPASEQVKAPRARRGRKLASPAAAGSSNGAGGKPPTAKPEPKSGTASVRNAISTKAKWKPEDVDTYHHTPTNRLDLAEPYRTFVLCHHGYAVEVHTGPGLTLNRLIEWSIGCSRESDGSYPHYDEAVFEGRRLRAVFHTTPGRIGFTSVTRFDVDGRASTEDLVTTPTEVPPPDPTEPYAT